MKKDSTIHLALEFAGVILPIKKNEQGTDIVPLKPVSDVFGLAWETQSRKFRVKIGSNSETCTLHMEGAGSGLGRRFGVCIGQFPHAGQDREMVAIRLDRVAAFINMINPDKVRAAGNEDGADFLERKQEEWDDLIHEYESAQGMFASQEQRAISKRNETVRSFLAVAREKRNTLSQSDRKALGFLMAEMAADLGIPYQHDVVDDMEKEPAALSMVPK